jgi:hypothetical protein
MTVSGAHHRAQSDEQLIVGKWELGFGPHERQPETGDKTSFEDITTGLINLARPMVGRSVPNT